MFRLSFLGFIKNIIPSHIIIVRNVEVGRRLPWRHGGPGRRVGCGRRRLRSVVDELAPGQLLAASDRSCEKAWQQRGHRQILVYNIMAAKADVSGAAKERTHVQFAKLNSSNEGAESGKAVTKKKK